MDTLPPGFVFDGYVLDSVLGQGGNGCVYKAHHIALDRMVAIKVLHKDLLDTPACRQRFRRESMILSAVKHPNIVDLFKAGEDSQGRPYLVLELLEGQTLGQFVKARGNLTHPQFMHIFMQVVEALSYAHASGLIHRDLKPSNIMLVARTSFDTTVEETQEESESIALQVKLIDFGIAKAVDSKSQALTITGALQGTTYYMSPEQCRGETADQRSDIYSLGCTMYEAVCGRPPFTGDSNLDIMYKHLHDNIARTARLKRLPDDITKLIMRCLQKDPKDRFQTMQELKHAMVRSADATMAEREALPSTAQVISALFLIVLCTIGWYCARVSQLRTSSGIEQSVADGGFTLIRRKLIAQSAVEQNLEENREEDKLKEVDSWFSVPEHFRSENLVVSTISLLDDQYCTPPNSPGRLIYYCHKWLQNAKFTEKEKMCLNILLLRALRDNKQTKDQAELLARLEAEHTAQKLNDRPMTNAGHLPGRYFYIRSQSHPADPKRQANELAQSLNTLTADGASLGYWIEARLEWSTIACGQENFELAQKIMEPICSRVYETGTRGQMVAMAIDHYARVLVSCGKVEAALQLYSIVLSRPTAADMRVRLLTGKVKTLATNGNTTELLPAIHEALSIVNSTCLLQTTLLNECSTLLDQEAGYYARRNEYEKAAQCLSKEIDVIQESSRANKEQARKETEHPELRRVYINYMECLERAGDFKSLESRIESSIDELQPVSGPSLDLAFLYYLKGLAANRRRDWKGAADNMYLALSILTVPQSLPTDLKRQRLIAAQTYETCCVTLTNTCNREDVFDATWQLTNKDPQWHEGLVRGHNFLSIRYRRKKLHAEALREALTSIKEIEANPTPEVKGLESITCTYVAACYIELGKPAEAAKWYAKANDAYVETFKANSMEALLCLNLCNISLHRYEQLGENLKKFVEAARAQPRLGDANRKLIEQCITSFEALPENVQTNEMRSYVAQCKLLVGSSISNGGAKP